MKKSKFKSRLLLLIALCVFLNLKAQNNALHFNGTNESVITDGHVLNFSGDNLTLEAWIYIESFPVGAYDISSIMGVEGTDATALLRLGDPGVNLAKNKLQFVETSGAGPTANKLSSNIEFKLNTWYHVAATYKYTSGVGEDLKLFINGIQVAGSGGSSTSGLTAHANFYVGAQFSGRFFNGKIDEVRVWNTTQSESEIRANMHKEISLPNTSLTLYYKFNESSGISADNAEGVASRDGRLFGANSSRWQTSSAFTGAKNTLNFDGVDDYCNTNSNVMTNTDNFTMMAWVKPNTLPVNGWSAIAYNGTDGGGYGIGIRDGKVAGLFGTTAWHTTNAVLPSTGTWYHIAMRRSNGTVQFFLNGKLLSYSSTTAPLSPMNRFTIGNMIANNETSLYDTSFDGQIDEVRVYNRSLTNQEIRNDMCNSLIGNETGLVAYYDFDNNSGTILQDFSGNANDLTLTNMDATTDWVSSTAFNTWLNTNSTTWSTATNWSRESSPVSTDNVGIRSYSGGSNPTLSGSPTVNNFVLGNAAILTLDSDVTINGNFILKNNLSLNGKTITLGSAATLYEDNGLISGTTGNIQTTRDLNNISAENVAGLGAIITTSSNMGSTTIIRSHSTSGNTLSRYYQINTTTNPTNATLIFNYDQSELNGQTEANLKLFKSTDKSAWVEQSSTVNTTDNTLTLTGINSFSWWTGANSGTTLSVEGFNKLNFRVIPLYIKNRIQIIGDVGQHASINIYDLLGKFIFTTNLEYFNNNEITIPKMAEGIYYIKVKTKNGDFNTKIAWF